MMPSNQPQYFNKANNGTSDFFHYFFKYLVQLPNIMRHNTKQMLNQTSSIHRLGVFLAGVVPRLFHVTEYEILFMNTILGWCNCNGQCLSFSAESCISSTTEHEG